MATLMQKDVLIEMAAYARSIIAHRTEPNTELNDDQVELVKMRNFIYSTSPDKLDFDKLVSEINYIKDKYISLPVNKFYL
ncbi:hypothetical protein [Aggregatibacter actinomycetemcomitans]|uniref:hypothetical protein n=1 Tax=Aggregatibacter actinomycetemcomitans TaxID=714 RepID=UPI00197B8471|nr:hypothetical protein [Aggregatibacter actinomycetemcomitans]MBN6078462.1 hypothetical protein [Aggregatibacter actinomycetemcomitans]